MHIRTRIVRVLASLCLMLAGLAHAGDLVLRPSLKYDALCLIGVLTGDPFYVRYYRTEYARFSAMMTREESAAFLRIKRVIKDEGKGLVAPQLALYLSASDAESLDAMIEAVRQPAALQGALRKTPYYDERVWSTRFDPARDDVVTALAFLKRIDFPAIWRRDYAARITERIAEIEMRLGDVRILDLQEKLLGHRPFEGPIIAYLAYFSKPHGIRIVGARYITAYDYPLGTILANAVHEPLHPPFRKDDPQLWRALEPLRHDADFVDRVEHHDPAFGYNSFEGLVEEDCVQALEQIVNERIGVGMPARRRFADSDDGLHILAAAIYALLKQDGYDERGGDFEAWLTDSRTVRRLAGNVKELAETVVGGGVVKPMRRRGSIPGAADARRQVGVYVPHAVHAHRIVMGAFRL